MGDVTIGTSGAFAAAAHFDAFGRLRTSHPHTLFDSKQLRDALPLYWDDSEVSGGGTSVAYSQARASTTMTVSASTAGKRVRQTFQRFNYQPGKSQFCLFTGVLTTSGGTSGITAAMGLFDDNNGLFVELDSDAIGFVVRSKVSGSVVDNRIEQGNWNKDRMDGSNGPFNPSGVTFNPSAAQIFWLDYEWLGVGSVRMGFVVDGQFIHCHTFNHANSLTSVYMSTPNLPARYQIENDGTGAESSLEHICTSVMSEGGIQPTGQLHYASTASRAGSAHVDAAVADTLYACVGMKLAATNLDQVVNLTSVSMLAETDDDFEWVLMFDPTVAGTFTYNGHSDSGVELAYGATANTVTGGHEMAGGFVNAAKQAGASVSDALDNALKLGSAIDGTPNAIVLCVRPLSIDADIHAGIGWREIS